MKTKQTKVKEIVARYSGKPKGQKKIHGIITGSGTVARPSFPTMGFNCFASLYLRKGKRYAPFQKKIFFDFFNESLSYRRTDPLFEVIRVGLVYGNTISFSV